MTQEERSQLLKTAIVETGSLREGLALFQEVVAALAPPVNGNGAEHVASPIVVSHRARPASSAPKPPNNNRPWTAEDIALASAMAAQHKSFAAIAEALGRSENAIYNAWYSRKFEHPDHPRREGELKLNGGGIHDQR